jgi:hypothetical protein
MPQTPHLSPSGSRAAALDTPITKSGGAQTPPLPRPRAAPDGLGYGFQGFRVWALGFRALRSGGRGVGATSERQ